MTGEWWCTECGLSDGVHDVQPTTDASEGIGLALCYHCPHYGENIMDPQAPITTKRVIVARAPMPQVKYHRNKQEVPMDMWSDTPASQWVVRGGLPTW